MNEISSELNIEQEESDFKISDCLQVPRKLKIPSQEIFSTSI